MLKLFICFFMLCTEVDGVRKKCSQITYYKFKIISQTESQFIYVTFALLKSSMKSWEVIFLPRIEIHVIKEFN